MIPTGAKSPQPAQSVVGREGDYGYRLRLRRYAVRIPLPDTAGRGRKHMFVQRHLSITPFLHVLANASLRRAQWRGSSPRSPRFIGLPDQTRAFRPVEIRGQHAAEAALIFNIDKERKRIRVFCHKIYKKLPNGPVGPVHLTGNPARRRRSAPVRRTVRAFVSMKERVFPCFCSSSSGGRRPGCFDGALFGDRQPMASGRHLYPDRPSRVTHVAETFLQSASACPDHPLSGHCRREA